MELLLLLLLIIRVGIVLYYVTIAMLGVFLVIVVMRCGNNSCSNGGRQTRVLSLRRATGRGRARGGELSEGGVACD